MQDRRLATDEPRDPSLQLKMNRLCAADKADGGHPEAPFIEAVARGLLHSRVIGQAQVIVRGQNHYVAPAFPFHSDAPALLAFERDFVLESFGFDYLFKLASQRRVKLLRIH